MATGGIIVVGDEILSGHIYDANSSYLVRRLSDLGIEVSSVCIVPDRIEAIVDRLADSLRKQDITLTSGGLGPTPDDLTKVAAARLLGRRLAIDETTADHIETLYARSGHRPPPSSAKQALVPQGSIVLENPIGLAPGLILVEGRRCLILLPGVPLELQRVFEAGVVPFIEEKYGSSPGPAVLIRTTGLPESEIVDLVSPVLTRFKDVHVSYLPSELGVDLRLSSSIRQQAMNECRDAIFATLQPYAYATDLTPISQVVGTLLRKRHATVCTAESCTGGLVADWLTDIPGSSDYYLGGVVCYSNHAKHSLLQVSEATLRKHGAVSSEVAQQMAARARSLFAAEYALALTGIAGPAGGTQKKPVGLVYIALAEPGGIAVWELHLNGPRRTIKIQAAMRALDYLRRILLNLPTTS